MPSKVVKCRFVDLFALIWFYAFLSFYIIGLLTGCFCIGPVIDSRLAVLDPRLESSANTADRESITGPMQKQPVPNTFIK